MANKVQKNEEKGPQITIDASILQSLIANQNALTEMLAAYKAQSTEAANAKARAEEVRKEEELSREKARAESEAKRRAEAREDTPVTQAELRRMLQTHREGSSMVINLKPPFTEDIIAFCYPPDYMPPAFRKFDGTGSAREHLLTYIDDLGMHGSDLCLRLREFLKSLTGRAFTWYSKLKHASISTWDEMATEFCNKFLEEEAAIHVMDLGRVRQRIGKNLVTFIKRYRNKAPSCRETLPEEDLVWLHQKCGGWFTDILVHEQDSHFHRTYQ